MKIPRAIRCALAVAAIVPFAAVRAQSTAPATSPGGPVVTKFTISPQALEKPALAYSLLPNYADTLPGNAALKYQMAIGVYLPARENATSEMKDFGDAVEHLREVPLAELDEATADKVLQYFNTPLKLLREGSRMDSIDWGTNLRQDGFMTLLPYLGPMRSLSNMLQISIRLDIKRHHWQDAHDKLQIGYAMAHQIGEGETIIDVLVGNVIAGEMNNCLQDWISEPDSPNLFWPIADLPQPFNSLRKAATFEHAVAYLNFPEWKAFSNGTATPDQLSSFTARLQTVASNDTLPNEQSPKYEQSFLGLAFAVAEYPRAKQFLIDHGQKAEDVEKLPVSEVVGKSFARSYEETVDDLYKWLGLPPEQALPGLAQAERTFEQEKHDNTTNLLANILMPALGRAVYITARVDRQLAVLRIAEALRSYAAQHNALPDSLDQLGLPLANDPVSGQPFTFKRNDNTIILAAPPPPDTSPVRGGIRYEITLRSH